MTHRKLGDSDSSPRPPLLGATGGRGRYDGIDALRSLAIVLVLLNHINMRLYLAGVPYTHGLPPQLVSSLVWNGQRGVQIFFAISGFLITSMAIERWRCLAHIRIGDFYTLRAARIAPLLLLLLAILSLLDIQHAHDYTIHPSTGGLGHALFAALTFQINVLEARHGYLPPNWDVLWSLSVEEAFYVAFPLICWALGRFRLVAPLFMVFVALGPIARTILSRDNPVWREYSYLGGMDAISMGCMTAVALSRHTLSRAQIVFCAVAGALLLASILCFSIRLDHWGLGRSGLDMTFVALGTCLLIAAATQGGWRIPLLLRPLLFPGRRSYEIYLTHMFVVLPMFSGFVALGRPLDFVPIFFVAAIIAATTLGGWVAGLYSDPLNAQIRRRFGLAAPTVAVTARPAST